MIGLQAEGLSVYDYLPGEEAPYPFVHLAESQQTDEANKTAIFGDVLQTINVWHTQKNRGTVSDMLLTCKKVCRNIQHTDNFSWCVRNVTQRIITDTTTETPLLHGVLQVQFKFS